ncbi:glycosyltransferase [Knoellia koreensis]|jgi:GT2 family glycosyltransferase|uniref:Glycosyltransferase n=1 Tax=Knoellia koreensis TaxID=2730921 RepID=A0A849HGY3_9MICO|nr:glycosyltransferase [Knoellia sp. DB2414S]NNM46678.1 glycosyltransferase [Knoellia sp. DB2414S]
MTGTTVVVVNYGTHDLLATNLIAVSDGSPDLDVVVVDNFSTVAEREAVRELCSRQGWRAVLVDRNVGFGEGVNRGAAAAVQGGADRLLILNPDATIGADSVRLLVDAVTADPMAMVSPVVLRPDGSTWFAGNVVHLRDGRIEATRRLDPARAHAVVPWLSGACLMVSRELWEKVGGFDPEYFMYWEDVDLSYRVQAVGGTVRVLPEATAVHDEGGSQRGAHRLSPLYYYFNIRNRLLFAARHLPAAGRRDWARSSLREGMAILRRGGRRHLVERGSPLATAARATLDGLRLVRDRRRGPSDPIRVLLSFPPPVVTSNPYNVMLAEAVADVPGVRVANFSWREALLGQYDVFHAHWPESAMAGRDRLRRAAKQVLFAVIVLRMRCKGVAWVRTMHNLALPEGISRFQRQLLLATERMTDLRILINEATPFDPTRPVEVVPHGDYRQWFAPFPRAERQPGRILFFGTVRRYKGLPRLVEAFRATTDEGLSLRIAGRVSNPEYEPELRALVAGDPRIDLTVGFVSDPDLVREVSAAQLVVLPYPEMHNSGSVLAALSLGTPVLVPDNEVNRRLSAEVGPGWVHTFADELEPQDLHRTLATLGEQWPPADPDLSARDWDLGGRLHAAAYRRAVGLRTGMGAPEPTSRHHQP